MCNTVNTPGPQTVLSIQFDKIGEILCIIFLEKFRCALLWNSWKIPIFLSIFSHNINFSLSSCVISSLYQDWSGGGVIYDCKLRSEKAPFYEYFQAFSTFLHISPTKESFFRNSLKKTRFSLNQWKNLNHILGCTNFFQRAASSWF